MPSRTFIGSGEEPVSGFKIQTTGLKSLKRVCYSSEDFGFWDSNALFWPSWPLAHTHPQVHTIYTNKNKIN